MPYFILSQAHPEGSCILDCAVWTLTGTKPHLVSYCWFYRGHKLLLGNCYCSFCVFPQAIRDITHYLTWYPHQEGLQKSRPLVH